MHRLARTLLASVLLAAAAPWTATAEPAPAEAGAEARSPGPAPQAAPAARPTAPSDSRPAAPPELTGVTGKILQVEADTLLVQPLGPDARKGPPTVTLHGGADVPVSGQPKREAWKDLRRGDLVAVSYTKADPPHIAKVLVLPPTVHPMAAAALGVTPKQKSGKRVFTGWIKYKDDELFVVRTPDAPPPSPRKGEVKVFKRHEGTRVGLLRDSWDDVRKGDRVTVEFGKGNPRPADTIDVVLRGGEKPLPSGLATRLYDPEFDAQVRDVDGIGEVRSGQAWQPATTPPPSKPWTPKP
jgi:hypothetical protein